MLLEQPDTGVQVDCVVGESKTFRAQEQLKQGSGWKEPGGLWAQEEVSVAGQKGQCGNEAEEVIRPDPAGPYRLYKDPSPYPGATGSPQSVFSKTCYMLRFGFQKDLLWPRCGEWTCRCAGAWAHRLPQCYARDGGIGLRLWSRDEVHEQISRLIKPKIPRTCYFIEYEVIGMTPSV